MVPKFNADFGSESSGLAWASARGLLDLAAEQPLGIAVGDAFGLILGKLRQPAALGLHDGVVAEPALVDPGIGAEQEAIGMTSERSEERRVGKEGRCRR